MSKQTRGKYIYIAATPFWLQNDLHSGNKLIILNFNRQFLCSVQYACLFHCPKLYGWKRNTFDAKWDSPTRT